MPERDPVAVDDLARDDAGPEPVGMQRRFQPLDLVLIDRVQLEITVRIGMQVLQRYLHSFPPGVVAISPPPARLCRRSSFPSRPTSPSAGRAPARVSLGALGNSGRIGTE